jgi:hypothetical protein
MLAITLALIAILAVWAAYKVIVYALPCLLGFGAGSVAISAGAGWVAAALTGLAAAVASFFVLRFLLSNAHSLALRRTVAIMLVLPTAVLAYNVGIDALASSVTTELWRQALAITFALVMSAIAFVRMTESDGANL